jgi:hypothetical protein
MDFGGVNLMAIETLSQDIYHILDSAVDHTADGNLCTAFALRTGAEVVNATRLRDKPREKGKLWASDIGKKCDRQHWYNFNSDNKEELLGHTKFKFLYGNILEETVLYLAEEAGHKVEFRQEPVSLEYNDWMVTGRIDAVVDEILIDVKTTSSFGYKKYVNQGIHEGNDSFGYLAQLGFYQAFGDFSKHPNEQGFIWIDKQNGHIKYKAADVPEPNALRNRVGGIIKAVESKADTDVERGYNPVPYGKSGNMSLPVQCSYCPHKETCHRDANNGSGLRTFLYSGGPTYFTNIEKEPNVQEITT